MFKDRIGFITIELRRLKEHKITFFTTNVKEYFTRPLFFCENLSIAQLLR